MKYKIGWVVLLGLWLVLGQSAAAQSGYVVQPGDTWAALAAQFGVPQADLQAQFGTINRQRQPVIGDSLALEAGNGRSGYLWRSNRSLLVQAALQKTSPWAIAAQNGLSNPYLPTFYRPLFMAGGDAPPRDLPMGFTSLEVSQTVAHAGEALAIRAQTEDSLAVAAHLGYWVVDLFRNGRALVGLTATTAFYGRGTPELAIEVADQPLWAQPWRIDDKEWIFQEMTLTGEAAEIDQASIDSERERMFALWAERSPVPLWTTPFDLPIHDYLEISAPYGARRSYNGGPYRTYHEGVDFSAYGGTAVTAPAAGRVILAEKLFVRGNAVIIDHGLGVYSGFYHMSELLVAPGDSVTAGQRVGSVGTTGFSTGNHLHWDLLVNVTWVDAQAWRDENLACWILAGWGTPCP